MKPDQIHKRILKKITKAIIGPVGYAKLLGTLYRVLNTRARGHQIYFSGWNNLIRAADENNEFFFCVPERAARYIWSNGPLEMTERLWAKYVDPKITTATGQIMIDVGANVGEFALAGAFRGLSVHAFEPDPFPFSALQKNLARYPNAVPNQIGIGNTPGAQEFFVATSLADSSFIKPEQFERSFRSTVITLDDYVRENGIRSIAILKVEAEGFEPEVLAGASNALGIAEFVTIDCGPERHGQDTFQECEALLQKAGLATERRGWILQGFQPKRVNH